MLSTEALYFEVHLTQGPASNIDQQQVSGEKCKGRAVAQQLFAVVSWP